MTGRQILRRLTGTMGLLTAAGGCLGLAAFLTTQGLERSTQWLSVMGGVLGVAAVAKGPLRTMTAWLRPGAVRSHLQVSEAMEALAQSLADQWNRDERRRGGRDPFVLPVRWEVTPEAEFAMAGVGWDDLGAGNGTVEPRLLAGEYDTIHETFTQRLPSRRLVVLGRAGGGKSSLARRLARDLLEHRTPGDPVPVFLSLASWNPEKDQDLYDWVSHLLNRDHPKLEELSPGPTGGTALPLSRRLADADHLLLVLDGFDEIPQASRRAALKGIDRLGGHIPVVVTSRTDEYRQAVQARGRGLPRAAAVELSSVDASAVKSYLTRTTPVLPPGRWDEVFRLLDQANGSAVAQALQVPLMIWLARNVYDDPESTPRELADPTAFADPTAVEIHLLDRMITAAYAHPGGRPHSGPDTIQRARRWLRFLAQWLDRKNTAEIAWWKLPTAAPGRAALLVTGLPVGLAAGIPTGIIISTFFGFWPGLVCGLAFAGLATTRAFSQAWHPLGDRLPGPIIGRAVALGVGLGTGLPIVLREELATGVAQGTSVGMLAGLAAGFIIHEGRTAPTRVEMAIRGNRLRILRSLVRGLLIGLLFGTALGVALGLVNGPTTGLVFAVLSMAMGLAMGIVDSLHIWIDTPTDVTRSISPRTVLHSDRSAALARALVAGPLVTAGAGLTTAFAYGPATGTAVGCAMASAYITTDRMVGLSATSWGRLTLVRPWLALRRQLPWHLMGFLDDAHDRGILRRSGAVHQFRHIRLQQRLAGSDT